MEAMKKVEYLIDSLRKSVHPTFFLNGIEKMQKLLSVVLALSIAFTPSLSSAGGSKKRVLALIGVAAGTAIYLANRKKELPVKVEVKMEHVLKAYDAVMDTPQDEIDFREKFHTFREAYVGLSAVAYSAYLIKVCSQENHDACEVGFRMAYIAAKRFDADDLFTNAVCNLTAMTISKRWMDMQKEIGNQANARNLAESEALMNRAGEEAYRFAQLGRSSKCAL